MLAFVIAIHREAEGLIAHFGLSKDMHPHPFAIYRGESVILTVSGVGKLNAAMATTYLLSLPDIHRDHVILVNYGCCASWSSTLPIGYLSAAVKVTDSDTHHDYFSDLASYVIPRATPNWSVYLPFAAPTTYHVYTFAGTTSTRCPLLYGVGGFATPPVNFAYINTLSESRQMDRSTSLCVGPSLHPQRSCSI